MRHWRALFAIGACIGALSAGGCGSEGALAADDAGDVPVSPPAGLGDAANVAHDLLSIDLGPLVTDSATSRSGDGHAPPPDLAPRADAQGSDGGSAAGPGDAGPADAPVPPGGSCEPGATVCGPAGGIRSCVTGPGGYEYGPEAACGGHQACASASPGKAACACPPVPANCQTNSYDCAGSKLTICARDPGGCAYVLRESDCLPEANGHASCALGTCQKACNGGFHECDGKCVADSDATACGLSCMLCTAAAGDPKSAATCTLGQCTLGCKSGYHQCGVYGLSACRSDTSVDSCGQECRPCSPPDNSVATCDGKACGFACNPGFVPCLGFFCVDQKGDDRMNCGACGKVCPETCRAGACQETRTVLAETFDGFPSAWQYDSAWTWGIEPDNATASMKGVSGGFAPCGPHDLLWSTDFSLANAAAASAAFAYKADGSAADRFQVVVSTDGGASWAVAGSVPRHALDWTGASVDLGAYAGKPTMRLGFRLLKNCADTLVQWWSLDAVEVRATMPTP